MISPKLCCYYVNQQCSLTWLAHVQHLFKQPTYTTTDTRPCLQKRKKKKSQSRRKVRVLTEPAHPLPLLQTIPTVFVNWCTFLFLNAEQFSEQSLHKTTHMRLEMQAKKQNTLSSKHTRLVRNSAVSLR